MVARITAYKSNDGQIFQYESEAAKRDAELRIAEWAEEQSLGRGGEWSQDMIVACIIENAEELHSALTSYVTSLPRAERAA